MSTSDDWRAKTLEQLGFLYWPMAVLCPTHVERTEIERTLAQTVKRSGGKLAMPMMAVDPKLDAAPPNLRVRMYKSEDDMPPRVRAIFRFAVAAGSA